MAKRFFYVCAGLLCLTLAYELGARNAIAQVGSPTSGFAAYPVAGGSAFWILTPNGDVYSSGWNFQYGVAGAEFKGNIWGAPTPTQPETWGRLKARYR